MVRASVAVGGMSFILLGLSPWIQTARSRQLSSKVLLQLFLLIFDFVSLLLHLPGLLSFLLCVG